MEQKVIEEREDNFEGAQISKGLIELSESCEELRTESRRMNQQSGFLVPTDLFMKLIAEQYYPIIVNESIDSKSMGYWALKTFVELSKFN